MTQETPEFHEAIHAPQRLRICALLTAAQKVEFGTVQQALGLSKSALSKHLTRLVEAGFVTQERAVRDARSRVWLQLTPAGRTAYRRHVAALREIIDGAGEPGVPSGGADRR